MKLAMKLFLFLVVALCLVWSASAAEYNVSTSTTTVDGDTFCGGVCDSTDTIVIDGGARGNLLFKDFDGSGSYITITNENTNPDSRVVLTSGSVGETYAVIELRDCKYVDLRGDNDPDIEYGLYLIYDGDPTMPSSMRVRKESDHIKISYIEVNDTAAYGTGIQVLDNTLSESWVFDTFEIHHNYIHGTGYAGMYLGHNNPPTEFNPYSANFSVHHNLLEDLGAYGITLKGIHADSGRNYIYNNTIRPSDRSASGGNSTGLVTAEDDSFKFGISGSRYYGDNGVDIYNNWIEKTVGKGIGAGVKNQNIFNNTILGCGIGNDTNEGSGIITFGSAANNVNMYDNIIIQPVRFGVYARELTTSGFMSRNLIGDAGLGEWDEYQEGDLTESSGDDANVYHADVASFGFDEWSDDDDYSNDEFTFLGDSDDTYDNFLSSNNPDTVYKDVIYSGVGQVSDSTLRKSLIWYNLSEYNSTDTVDSALLNLTWYYNGTGRNKSTNAGIYLSNATTDTDYLNWNNSSNGVAWREPGGNWLDANWVDNGTTPFASVLIPNTAADNSSHSFDITVLVQAIVNESRTNNGFFVIANETDTNYIAFASLDHTTEAYNPTLNITHSIAGAGAPSASDFTYYKIITLNQSMINQSIGTGKYPLLVSDTDADLIGCQADGDDIVYFDADNTTQLPHENETWNSTTGEIVHWTGIEDVTNVSYIVMYYNNSTIANSENATGVWDSNYMMVQHFQETDIDGGANDIKDSTSNDNDGTTHNMTTANLDTGLINGCFNFSKSNEARVNVSDDSTLDGFTTGFTISGLFNFNQEGEYYLVNKYDAGGDQRAWLLKLQGDDNIRIYVDDAGTAAEISNFNPTIVPGTDYKIDAVWESGEYPLLYFDGALANEVDHDGLVSSIKDSSAILRIGGGYTAGDTYFTGDEIRVSNIARSQAYIETDYNNSAHPDLFISIGAEQGGGAPDTKFEYWTGSVWNEGPSEYYLWFTCFWHTAECANAEQSSGQSTLKITNNGTAAGTPKMKLNESAPAGIRIFVDDDNTFADAVELSNTYQAVSTSLNNDTNITLWAWANLSGADNWEFETYAIVE